MSTVHPSPDKTAEYLAAIKTRVGEIVVGQEVVVERTLIALLTSGHLLLEGTRTLSGNLSLYFDFTQAILFGDNDTKVRYRDGFKSSDSSDTLTFVTEIGGGLEYSFGAGHIRVGGEGQYWNIDGSDLGIYGGIAEIGWSF